MLMPRAHGASTCAAQPPESGTQACHQVPAKPHASPPVATAARCNSGARQVAMHRPVTCRHTAPFHSHSWRRIETEHGQGQSFEQLEEEAGLKSSRGASRRAPGGTPWAAGRGGGMSSGKKACSSGEVKRRMRPCVCSVSASSHSSRLRCCRPSGPWPAPAPCAQPVSAASLLASPHSHPPCCCLPFPTQRAHALLQVKAADTSKGCMDRFKAFNIREHAYPAQGWRQGGTRPRLQRTVPAL